MRRYRRLIVINGICPFTIPGFETNLFSLNTPQLEQMQGDDKPCISLIERLLSQPRRLIVTILIGKDFANIAAPVISSSPVIRLISSENQLTVSVRLSLPH